MSPPYIVLELPERRSTADPLVSKLSVEDFEIRLMPGKGRYFRVLEVGGLSEPNSSLVACSVTEELHLQIRMAEIGERIEMLRTQRAASEHNPE